jgi:hypothetical protein
VAGDEIDFHRHMIDPKRLGGYGTHSEGTCHLRLCRPVAHNPCRAHGRAICALECPCHHSFGLITVIFSALLKNVVIESAGA